MLGVWNLELPHGFNPMVGWGRRWKAFYVENLFMKVLVLLAGLAVMCFVTGCEEEHEHHHHNEGYGGSYEGNYPGTGHGEYRGYPDYPVDQDHHH